MGLKTCQRNRNATLVMTVINWGTRPGLSAGQSPLRAGVVSLYRLFLTDQDARDLSSRHVRSVVGQLLNSRIIITIFVLFSSYCD